MKSRICIFTLIELLVVIAIIGILMTILLPALKKAQTVSKRAFCAGNERQIHLAWYNYVGDSDGRLPLSDTTLLFGDPNTDYHTWIWLLSDYLKPSAYVDAGNVKRIRKGSILTCPEKIFNTSSDTFFGTDYGMNDYGIGGRTVNNSRPYRTINDLRKPSELAGFADTVRWLWRVDDLGWGYYKVDRVSYHHFRHGGRSNISFCDAHVEAKDRSFIGSPWNWWNIAPWGNP